MSPRTGRPKSEDPKTKLLQVRIGEKELAILDECANRKQSTRAEIVREGIQLVKRELDEKK